MRELADVDTGRIAIERHPDLEGHGALRRRPAPLTQPRSVRGSHVPYQIGSKFYESFNQARRWSGTGDRECPFERRKRPLMDQDHHRDKARECVSLAAQARSPRERLELLDMAQAFLRLAAFTMQRCEEKASPSTSSA
jgi:hypothetical protein